MKQAQNKFLSASIVTLLVLAGSAVAMLWLPEKISVDAYKSAFVALDAYRTTHPEENPRYLAVVDFTKPSFIKRLALIDLKTGEEFFYRVAHGKNSGELFASWFSDTSESNMSSLGLYKVLETYSGDHGKAMRLEGLEPSVNSNAFSRDIVLHSAEYVSLRYIFINLLTLNGPRIGRSNGCFVVSPHAIDEVVQKLNHGAFLYAWADSK
ncbi:conserved hypothetical protein [Chlorobium phaeobacteroides DSM 266]|uniref:Murein L,D-transpeptidase catalytic domain family protein n=1 Tax=Chlorobium phaeobacteroides (strain DSM 266 / SMG 266 / 2430) TaxID=290317 RepID=A1BEA9_CHLPD|nr:conserved hypothetical protein [Chlorobium phaeobacteroides DSM 266]